MDVILSMFAYFVAHKFKMETCKVLLSGSVIGLQGSRNLLCICTLYLSFVCTLDNVKSEVVTSGDIDAVWAVVLGFADGYARATRRRRHTHIFLYINTHIGVLRDLMNKRVNFQDKIR